jgi:citrate lyase beta subunit
MPSTSVTVRRSVLTLPGHQLRFHEKAAASAADEVMPDCEDACPLSAKGPEVRGVIVRSFTTLDWSGKFVTFRPNNTESPFFHDDLEHIVKGAPDRFHGVVIPKVSTPEQVERVDELLTSFEAASGWKTRLRIEALVESALGIENAFRVATASDRMASLIFGIADYSADVGIADAYTDQNQRFLYQKGRVVNAAKAAGIDAIDNVHLAVHDLEALRRYTAESAGLGFDGRWCITPAHIPVANELYSPTDKQLEHARKVVELYERADAEGIGAIVDPDNGEMIDEATIKIAFRQLLKAYKDGRVDREFLANATRRSAASMGYDFLGVEV